jgi:hypothetical protein
MILTDFIFNLGATCLILSVYSIVVYRWLQLGELKRAGKRAFAIMGERSGDSKRTRLLEEALTTGILQTQVFGGGAQGALLTAGSDWAMSILRDQGVEVEGRDLLLLMQSPQIRQLVEPFMSQLSANIQKTVISTDKEIQDSGKYVLKSYR